MLLLMVPHLANNQAMEVLPVLLPPPVLTKLVETDLLELPQLLPLQETMELMVLHQEQVLDQEPEQVLPPLPQPLPLVLPLVLEAHTEP